MAVVLIIGRRGYGKTTLALRLMKEAYRRGRRTLAAYAPNGLPSFLKNKIQLLSSLKEVQNLQNAAILVDDASAYLRGIVSEAEIREAVVSARHRGIDLFFVYHNVGQTPPFVISLSDVVIFFKLMDRPEVLKAKLGYDSELLRTALQALTLDKYKWVAYNLNTHRQVGYAYL